MLRRFLDGSPESPDGIAPWFTEVGAAPTATNAVYPPGSIVRFGTTYYQQTGTLAAPVWNQLSTLLVAGDPGPGWLSTHLSRAAALAGLTASQLTYTLADTFTTDEPFASAAAGGGSNTRSGSNGGTLAMATSAAAGGACDLNNSNGALSVVNAKTTRWYVAVRGKVITATDAATVMLIVQIWTNINNRVSLNLVNGVLNLDLVAGGVATTIATTWTPDITDFHDFAIAFDLTTIRAYVDGVLVGSQATLTNCPTVAGIVDSNITNGATAANRALTVDKQLMVTGQGA